MFDRLSRVLTESISVLTTACKVMSAPRRPPVEVTTLPRSVHDTGDICFLDERAEVVQVTILTDSHNTPD